MNKKYFIRLMILITLLGMITLPVFSFSDEGTMEAVDALGRRLLIHDDHTWRFAEPDVQNLYWGMSTEHVRMTSGKWLTSLERDVLMDRNASAFNMNNGMLVLTFDNNQLTEAVYLFDEYYADGNLHIQEYKTLVEQFSLMYGEPKENVVEWIGEETEDIGKAFLDGKVSMLSKWETRRSNIGCGLVNADNVFGLIIMYERIE